MSPAGLRRYENQEIALFGGYSRSGAVPEGTVGAGFMVLDKTRMADGVPMQVGTVELFLLQPQLRLFHGLVRIDVPPPLRRQGIGRRIIEAVAATAPDGELKIYDVQREALPFWVSLGCTFQARPPTWDAQFRLPAVAEAGRSGSAKAPPPCGITPA